MVLNLAAYETNLLGENSNVYLARGGVPYPSIYNNARVKCAELITHVLKKEDENERATEHKKILSTVVLQFTDSVFACFMANDDQAMTNLPDEDRGVEEYQPNYREDGQAKSYYRLNRDPIVKLKMIRGYNQNLYFAEISHSKVTEIINVYLDPVGGESKEGDACLGVSKQSIHKLNGCDLVAMEIDNSNVQDDRQGEVKNQLFLLDSLQKITQIWKDPGQKFYHKRCFNLP